MSVYVKEKPDYLDTALNSIWLEQESRPTEIILVKDGPLTEPLEAIITKWHALLDSKMKVVALSQNVGLAQALNIGLSHCQYELVARMDTDDVSLPNRFKLQLEYLNKYTSIAACSGQVDEFDNRLVNKTGSRNLPTDPDTLKEFCRSRSPLSHPAVMYRKNIIESVGGYPNFRNSQDWALWSVLVCKNYPIGNLEQTLVKMRCDNELMLRRGGKYLINEIKLTHYQYIIGLINKRELVLNTIKKSILRLSPLFIKKFLYKNFR